jgi:hypothetical protein
MVNFVEEMRVVFRMHRLDYKRLKCVALFGKVNSNVDLAIDTCLGGCCG